MGDVMEDELERQVIELEDQEPPAEEEVSVPEVVKIYGERKPETFCEYFVWLFTTEKLIPT